MSLFFQLLFLLYDDLVVDEANIESLTKAETTNTSSPPSRCHLTSGL